MTRTHTPGPWKIAKRTIPGQFVTYTHIVAAHDDHIALVGPCEIDANSHLIAAAPELLSALEGILNFERGKFDCPWDIHLETICSAIAKARWI